jgi:hypothetical protein
VRHRRISLAVATAVVGAAFAVAAAPATPAAAAVAADPATNVAPSPDYWPTCLQNGANSSACISAVVTAINNARALESVPPMTLPSGFAAMSPAVQTFVVSNLERVDRGLQPAAGMVGTLNTLAGEAAVADADPILPSWSPIGPFSPNRWGSNWAGDLNALAADYDWMYNDGWGPDGSYNIDCTSATASGCWGHRHNVLSTYGGEALITGVGSVQQDQWTSIAQIFVAGTGDYPAFTTSWASIAGTGATQTASPSTASPDATPDSTSLSSTAPGTIVAGRSARVSGVLTDLTLGAAVAGRTVRICHRTVTTTSTSCTSVTTDSTGTAALTVRPTLTTVYWLVYDGSPTMAPSTSSQVTVHVRPALTLRASHASTGWKIAATLTPAHGQTVRVQRSTALGWKTVRTVVAHSTMSFSRLRAGRYRVVVGAVTGSLRAVGKVRAGV